MSLLDDYEVPEQGNDGKHELKNVTRDASGSPTKVPTAKVVAGTIGASVGTAVSTVGIWILESALKLDIPQAIELSIGVLVTAGLAFVAGYFKAPGSNES